MSARLLPTVAVAVLLASCRRGDSAAAGPRRHVVEISAMAFAPARLEITAGDTVVWINRDLVPHNATGTGWNTAVMAQHAQEVLVMNETGEAAYRCTLHPVMEGSIAVRPRR